MITLLLVISLTLTTESSFAQVTGSTGFNLSLSEAVRFAKAQNKTVQAARIEESATGEDRKDAYLAALPTVTHTHVPAWPVPF